MSVYVTPGHHPSTPMEISMSLQTQPTIQHWAPKLRSQVSSPAPQAFSPERRKESRRDTNSHVILGAPMRSKALSRVRRTRGSSRNRTASWIQDWEPEPRSQAQRQHRKRGWDSVAGEHCGLQRWAWGTACWSNAAGVEEDGAIYECMVPCMGCIK